MKNKNNMNDNDKYVVIVNCSDGDLIISQNGNKHFTLQQAEQIILEHINLGNKVNMYKVIE